MNRFRRDLRCTIADFSAGRMPRYEIDTFSTPEGTLGIKLLPEVRLGTKPDEITTTKTSTNIYWFCKHLEQSGWLVKECFIGEEPDKLINGKKHKILTYDLTTGIWLPREQKICAYIIVRKIDETDIGEKNGKQNRKSKV